MADLKEIFQLHLVYEGGMLAETHARLKARTYDDPVVVNALIESFCIHARGLIDFFNGRKGVKASSFTEPTYKPFPNGQISSGLIQKLNTQIVHLTLKRTTTDKIDDDDRDELLVGITAELNNFVKHLTKEYRDLCGTDSTSVQPSATNMPSSARFTSPPKED
jgi:hypothetical protein